MTNEEKLLSLLQPKEYMSKIKLYCNDSKFSIERYIPKTSNNRVKQIKITEI